MPVHSFVAFDKNTPLTLESGRTLSPITVCYETFGKLNADKSNAVLVCHALTGDSHVATTSDKPGWWDSVIGVDKPINTDDYFVICSNVLGSCYGTTGPSSINPVTHSFYGLSFPLVTISDMVTVQEKLINHLEISKLHAVMGASMGAFQVLEWAIAYPEKMNKAIVVATGPKLTTQSLAFNMIGREAIMSDPNWESGSYSELPRRGLSLARMLGHVTYRSNVSLDSKFGRKLQEKKDYGYDFSTDFEIESYLKYQGDKFCQRFDANTYLYLARAMSYFDLAKKYGSLNDAFQHVVAQLLFVSFSSDWLYPPASSREMVKSLMSLRKDVTYIDIDSPNGHDSFLMSNAEFETIISNFIRSPRL